LIDSFKPGGLFSRSRSQSLPAIVYHFDLDFDLSV